MTDFFPTLCLYNPYYIGDTVLLEPIARTLKERLPTDISIASDYPELLIGHPTIDGVFPRDIPPAARVIDMGDSIKSLRENGKKMLILPNKIVRMYEEAGLGERDIKSPELSLTAQERAEASSQRAMLPPNRIGVVLESRHEYKNLPYIRSLIRMLSKAGYSVFAFGGSLKNPDILNGLPVFSLVDRSLRESMVYMSLMDVMVGPDTGLMHIGGALGIPLVPVTRHIWRDLYEMYNNVEIVSTKSLSKYGLRSISTRPSKVVKAVGGLLGVEAETLPVFSIPASKCEGVVGLFRLDGLGGSITLTDQAKKIYEATGRKSVPIIRSCGIAFHENPHIDNVIEVGYVKWPECLEQMLDRFDTLAEIKFAPGKWHQKGEQLFDQDFAQMQGLFDAFPIEFRSLEIHNMHQVQLTDQTLGLPNDSIDMNIYYDKKYPGSLPPEYIAIANGVDTHHKGMLQTKCWDKWSDLVPELPLPVVQIGTPHDAVIKGAAVDARDATLPQFFYLIKNATAVVCTEGGVMHVAYALKAPKVIVLRGPTRGKLFEYPGHHFVDSYLCEICWSRTGDWYEHCPNGIGAVCMSSITPQRVAYNVGEVLNEAVA